MWTISFFRVLYERSINNVNVMYVLIGEFAIFFTTNVDFVFLNYLIYIIMICILSPQMQNESGQRRGLYKFPSASLLFLGRHPCFGVQKCLESSEFQKTIMLAYPNG